MRLEAQTLEWMNDMLQSITKEEVNATAASLLSFATHYRREGQLLEEAAASPSTFGGPGPTRTTAIIACIPAFTDSSGNSTGALRLLRSLHMVWSCCSCFGFGVVRLCRCGGEI